MDALIIFGSTFLAVFALGLQSLNVNQGYYIPAALTSTLISTGHIYLYELMPQATLGTRLGYFLGGIVGITASMWFHRRVRAWWKARRDRRIVISNDLLSLDLTKIQRELYGGYGAGGDEHADIARCGLMRDDTH